MRAGSCFFWFVQGTGEAGRRPPAEGGHTGKARVGGCAARPVARPAPGTSYISAARPVARPAPGTSYISAARPVARPAPGTSYISAASFFSRPSARRSTSAKFVASM